MQTLQIVITITLIVILIFLTIFLIKNKELPELNINTDNNNMKTDPIQPPTPPTTPTPIPPSTPQESNTLTTSVPKIDSGHSESSYGQQGTPYEEADSGSYQSKRDSCPVPRIRSKVYVHMRSPCEVEQDPSTLVRVRCFQGCTSGCVCTSSCQLATSSPSPCLSESGLYRFDEEGEQLSPYTPWL